MSEKDKKKLITYGMYCNHIKEIQHFDVMQTFFRVLTSTLLLASFAAIGFIFSLAQTHILFGRLFIVIMIGFIGISSFFTLWYLDLVFYERLLVSHFAEAFRLEKEHEWLPKVQHNMLFSVHKQDHPSNIVYYYIGCVLSLIITIGLVVSANFYYIHDLPMNSLYTIIATVSLMILSVWFLKKKTKRISDFMISINYIGKEDVRRTPGR